MEKIDIVKHAAVIVRDGKYLVAKEKGDDFWKNVGGEIDGEETVEECLRREIKEELDADVVGTPEYYFSTPVTDTESEPKRKLIINMYKTEIAGEPKASSEIEEIHWVSKEEFEKGEIYLTHQIRDYIMPRLIDDGLVK